MRRGGRSGGRQRKVLRRLPSGAGGGCGAGRCSRQEAVGSERATHRPLEMNFELFVGLLHGAMKKKIGAFGVLLIRVLCANFAVHLFV